MHIFLMVLKIIGIVIISIVAIILLAALLLLFWPIRYRIRFEKKDNFYFKFKATWLLHVISARFLYQDKATFVVRILGIPVYRRNLDDQKAENGDDATDTSDKTDTSLQTESTLQNHTVDNENQEVAEQQTSDGTVEIDESADDKDNEDADDNELTPEEQVEEDEISSLGFFGKIKYFLKKMKELFLAIKEKCSNIEYTFQRIYAKIKESYALAQYYYKVWNRPKTKTSLLMCKTQLFKLLKHLKPRKFRSVLEFGTGDPASTAQIYGYYCMAQPWLGKNVIMNPHFEEKVLTTHTDARGRVFIVTLIKIAWKLYFDKDLRQLIRLVKREGKKNGRK